MEVNPILYDLLHLFNLQKEAKLVTELKKAERESLHKEIVEFKKEYEKRAH